MLLILCARVARMNKFEYGHASLGSLNVLFVYM